MPAHYICPHCGAQTLLADQHAGAAGSCARCGKQGTAPVTVGGPAAPPPSRSTPLVLLVVSAVVLLVVCGGIVASLAVPEVSSARRAVCSNKLKMLALAMLSYESTTHSFPPAYTADSAGKPLHSWRTLILPFAEKRDLQESLKMDEPWDSPNNAIPAGTVLPMFCCPSESRGPSIQTSYVVIAGPKTVFDGRKAARMKDIYDRVSDTILVVEVPNSGIPWGQPKDLTEEEFVDGFTSGTLKSPHPDGINVVMCDGSVHFLHRSTSAETLRRLIEKADGQPIESDF